MGLQNATELQKNGKYNEAIKHYKRVWDRREDVETDIAKEVLLNIGIMHFFSNRWTKSIKIAKKYLSSFDNTMEQKRNAENIIRQAELKLAQQKKGQAYPSSEL